MKRFWMWLSGCWYLGIRLTGLEDKLDRLTLESKRWDVRIENQLRTLALSAERYQQELDQTQRMVSDLQVFNRKLEEGLEATREQLRTAEEITIPGLVAAHDVLLKRWQSESMILTMRQVVNNKESD